MDPSISEAIAKLKSEKRIITNKVIEFSNAFKNTIARLEKKFDEKCTLLENKLDELDKKKTTNVYKLDTIFDDIEGLKKDEVKLSDDISNLEAEKDQVDKKINLIDKSLEEINKKFEEFK